MLDNKVTTKTWVMVNGTSALDDPMQYSNQSIFLTAQAIYLGVNKCTFPLHGYLCFPSHKAELG